MKIRFHVKWPLKLPDINENFASPLKILSIKVTYIILKNRFVPNRKRNDPLLQRLVNWLMLFKEITAFCLRMI